jgi:hypothetical protein
MKEAFQEHAFKRASRELIAQCNEIIADYQAQDLRLTLRQLYYQLVTRNLLENKERSYKNLSSVVSDARLAGLMDWAAIEDRTRQPRTPSEFESVAELVEVALASYRLPRWEGQSRYVELWVEKDALAGVLTPLASEFHVTLMVNRGYSSQSAMYESAGRFIDNERDEPGRLLYLGDLDPSGEDMVRDIDARLTTFGASVEVVKLALTRAQVDEYNPPPNPAKLTDPRAKDYIARLGNHSWEVDALPPEVLAALIRDAFTELLDLGRLEAVKQREAADKQILQDAVRGLTA